MDQGADSYRRFLGGDDNGLAEIVKAYNDGLTLYLNSFVGDLSVADELSEDTFVKLGVKKPRFSGKASFKTWLYAIGRNVALDYLRRSGARAGLSLEDCAEQTDGETVETRFLRDERKTVLHRAMRRLKSEYRQVLWLTYFEELSAREIAGIMRRSVHSIENLRSRAKQSLRAELNQEGYFYENL